MPIKLIDDERRKLSRVHELMAPGEIYAPGEMGTGGEYIRPGPDPMSPRDIIGMETGYFSNVGQQIDPAKEAERLNMIQEITGARYTGGSQPEPYERTKVDQAAAKRFQELSTADKMAVNMVMSGKMEPEKYYAIAKKSEVDREKSMFDFLAKIDPQKGPVDLMRGGQNIPLTGKNLMELMSPGGDVSADIGRPYPSVKVGITKGKSEGPSGSEALRASDLSEEEKKRIAAINEGKTLLSNLVTTFKESGYGGIGSAVGETTAKVPLIGKHLASKHAEYQKQKELASEVWLRAATGAATNPSEIKRYAGFLPDESDPPDLAQSKIDNFFEKINVLAKGRGDAIEIEAKGLEKLGKLELAKAKRIQVGAINDLIGEARLSIPKIVQIGEKQKTAVSEIDRERIRELLRKKR